MLDERFLLLRGLLFFERFELLATVVLGTLDEALPDVPLLIKGTLVGDEEVIKELQVD